jgi:hypothetical protein
MYTLLRKDLFILAAELPQGEFTSPSGDNLKRKMP